jgi:hypothetical protein
MVLPSGGPIAQLAGVAAQVGIDLEIADLGGVDGAQGLHGRSFIGGNAGTQQVRDGDGGYDNDDAHNHEQFKE